MAACALKPEDKRRQIQLVGNDLLKNYGKKKYYSVEEVKQANKRSHIDFDFYCWSHAIFNSHSDFDEYHRSMGEVCDYISMKAEMLSSISIQPEAVSWFDFDLSWLEFPNIEWSIFDFIDF